MSKLSIAQRRELQLTELINNYINDEQAARKIFNSYYRYVALYARCLEADSDESIYGTAYYNELQQKEEQWRERLENYLRPYGISIFVPWSIPYLGIKDANSGAIIKHVIEPILY